MSNHINKEINKIKIPKEIRERSRVGVQMAKAEIPPSKRYRQNGLALIVALLLIFAGYNFYQSKMNPSQNNASYDGINPIINDNGSLTIPAISLPNSKDGVEMDMIGLIVYNGKIYTQSDTEINPKDAHELIGEKIGQTKGNIDEWSTQDAYATELASTTSEDDVFTVKGYDKNFRIMTYTEYDGEIYTEFYENLNGITIHNGADVFGKLKMVGNIVNANYQKYSDWYHGKENHYPVENEDILHLFVEQLNQTVPVDYKSAEKVLGDYYNDQKYRRIILQLVDGSKVNIVVTKDGYIRYGFQDVYFKMDDTIFADMWKQLDGE